MVSATSAGIRKLPIHSCQMAHNYLQHFFLFSCGSKYNDDPFDSTKEESFKPGLPDDMRDRIAALAAKKAEEIREREE